MPLHIALAQFRPVKGDSAATFARISEWFGRAKAAPTPPDLVVFPETATTGYFLEGGVAEHAVTADELLTRLADAWERAPGPADSPDRSNPPSRPRRLDVVIGFIERHEGRLHNAALYATLGPGGPRIIHVHRKVFLPTYGVFQEQRFVDAGRSVEAFDTDWGRGAILICEDFWHAAPSAMAVLDGAELLIVPSASPARGAAPGAGIPGNLARWERLARSRAEEHGVAVVVSQLVGFEGGKGFAGGSLVYGPNGALVHRSVLWDETLDFVEVDLPNARPAPAPADESALADLRRALPEEARERGLAAEAAAFPAFRDGGARDPALLDIDTALVEEWLVRFLREEIARRRGFERAVVGLSGGVDSSVTAALCARALGAGNVTGFLLPYATSSPESAEHAMLVADQLGIAMRTIEITPAVDGYLENYEADAGPTRRGNVMARMRMIVLFDQAVKRGALPVGTGNKSERLLGYFTWHADDSPPINPLGDLFKTQVWALARHLGLPDAIVDKPASADLVRGQTDEADLGVSYTEADLILLHLLEGRTPDWLAAAGFDREHVATVRRRLEGTHWKRNLPTVAMLSATAIGEWYLRPVDY